MVVEGCLVSFLATILGLGAMAMGLPPFGKSLMTRGPMVFGVVQLLYVAPIALVFAYFRRTNAVIGIVVGGSLVFLLSAACAGIVGSIGR